LLSEFHPYTVNELLQKLNTPLIPVMGGKETSKESSATQKLEENEEPLSIDEVFVWWLESPEISKTIICIRKIPQTTLDISVPQTQLYLL